MCRRLCCRYSHLERSLASNAWPWFKSRCYIKYGFRLSVLVLFLKGFAPRIPVFIFPQKPTFPNPQIRWLLSNVWQLLKFRASPNISFASWAFDRCSHLTVRSLKYSLWLLNSFLQIPTHAQYPFCPWSVLMHWNLNGGKPKRLRVMLFRTTLTCTIMLDMLMKWLPRSNLSVNIHVCMLLSSSSDPDPRTIFIIICIMLNVTFPRLEIQSRFNNRDR